MKKILSHIAIAISLMIICFFVIDIFNEAMAFLNNTATKIIALILAIISLILSIINIYFDKT